METHGGRLVEAVDTFAGKPASHWVPPRETTANVVQPSAPVDEGGVRFWCTHRAPVSQVSHQAAKFL